ncbi:unnamed protein product [Cylindrotheca closterium]|uniref:Uncharacterized protein n=1 Tax=Cylindrotheca closterium TaxID=2856 RepID=A0AAD2FCT2_9STRA|nr:unnamed protein product [Cylindrotheca closterium]
MDDQNIFRDRLPLHTTHQRVVNRSRDNSPTPSKRDDATSPCRRVIGSDATAYHTQSQQFLLALNIAGMASFLLITVFDLFHVDVFLRAYRLPLETFSTGNLIFSLINTTTVFLGAWLLDSLASRGRRSDLIGVSGILFALAFLAPFFRWKEPLTRFWDGAHFVLSISLYDTISGFNKVLLGSLVTDNHLMTDKERIWFMASSQVANLTVGLFVARIGLEVFDEENMHRFQRFLKFLASVSALMFCTSQVLAKHAIRSERKKAERRKEKDEDDTTTEPVLMFSGPFSGPRPKQLKLRQAITDLWNHKNFWSWIKMELLLESQVGFVNAFLKTFIDRLVFDAGMSRDYCDWILSAIPPAGLICGVLTYIPIRTFGYHRVYPILFAANIGLCCGMLLLADHQSTDHIIFFLLVYPTITGAVQSAGFHLVMSDMVLEMKRVHASEQRFDQPSLAGLFMGVNALFCKPAAYMLPIIAASSLGDSEISLEESEHGSDHVREILFRLLIWPPLMFSILQWIAWRSFTLNPAKTKQIRDELIRTVSDRTKLGINASSSSR